MQSGSMKNLDSKQHMKGLNSRCRLSANNLFKSDSQRLAFLLYVAFSV